MVRLNRIYTRTGDDGTTGLGDGERRPKFDARVTAYGEVDETNCAIGLARLATGAPTIRISPPSTRRSRACRTICSISAPTSARRRRQGRRRTRALRVAPSQVERLERESTHSTPNFAAALVRAARRVARRRGAASGAHDLPARRARDRRARGDPGEASARRRSPTSIACPTICSSPRVTPTTAAAATCCGFPAPIKTRSDAMTNSCSIRRRSPRSPIDGLDRRYPGRAHLLRRAQLRGPREGNGPSRRPREAVLFLQERDGAARGRARRIPYPPGTTNYHFEVELVVAIGAPAFKTPRATRSTRSTATPAAST